MCSFSLAGTQLPPAFFVKMDPSHIWGQETTKLRATFSCVIAFFFDRMKSPQAIIRFQVWFFLQLLSWWFLFHTTDDWKCYTSFLCMTLFHVCMSMERYKINSLENLSHFFLIFIFYYTKIQALNYQRGVRRKIVTLFELKLHTGI